MASRGLTPTIDQHPAKWSQAVLDAIVPYVSAEAGRVGRPLRVLDPCCGVGLDRLADALGETVDHVIGVELQPEWAHCSDKPGRTVHQGDATDLSPLFGCDFDCGICSFCYGSRMADHHDAKDPCSQCGGTGWLTDRDSAGWKKCKACGGTGLSKRNTYAHVLRTGGGDLVPGSAAGMQWGPRYRTEHGRMIGEWIRCVVPGGLLVVNMSNHIRDGREQKVVEWWVNSLLVAGCGLVEVRRVATPRNRQGANGDVRVDGEVLIVMRTPESRRAL